LWTPLVHHRVLQVLHNPRYAGAFFHGRVHSRQDGNGRTLYKVLPVEEWHTLLPETHPGYITWEQYQNHLRRLRENSQAHGKDRRHGPAGEGPALLQGLVMCGICGQRMTVRYHTLSSGRLVPSYVCQRQGIEQAQRICQVVPGASLDQAVGTLLLQLMTPVTLEVALAVQQELQARWADADRLRRQQVQRARYEADLAHERFLHVDPKNRFVADALEADWNDKLRLLADAEEQYQKQSQADRATLDQQTKDKVLALASDFPRLWRDARTSDRDRKRMVRLLIEDATLSKTACLTVQVRCKGGTTHTLTLPLPLNGGKSWKTSPEVVALIDQLLDQHTDGQIAQILNDHGRRSGKGRKFTSPLVCKIRQAYRLKSRYTRLRAAGMLSVKQMARQLKICTKTVKVWRRCGLLKAHAYNDKNQYLYERLGQRRPRKRPGLDHSDPRRFTNVFSQEPKEVQDEV
jgi:Recombinase zinc beta ribbon domain/Recombinase